MEMDDRFKIEALLNTIKCMGEQLVAVHEELSSLEKQRIREGEEVRKKLQETILLSEEQKMYIRELELKIEEGEKLRKELEKKQEMEMDDRFKIETLNTIKRMEEQMAAVHDSLAILLDSKEQRIREGEELPKKLQETILLSEEQKIYIRELELKIEEGEKLRKELEKKQEMEMDRFKIETLNNIKRMEEQMAAVHDSLAILLDSKEQRIRGEELRKKLQEL